MLDYLYESVGKLSGVSSPVQAALSEQLNIQSIEDLLHFFPLRYVDRTRCWQVMEIYQNRTIKEAQLIGEIVQVEKIGRQRGKQRLVAQFVQGQEQIELIWFRGVDSVERLLRKYLHKPVIIFGGIEFFRDSFSVSHPEIQFYKKDDHQKYLKIEPVYPSGTKLTRRKLTQTFFQKAISEALHKMAEKKQDSLPTNITEELRLYPLWSAYVCIHFPKEISQVKQALRRLKFEELFYNQLGHAVRKQEHRMYTKGLVLDKTMTLTRKFTDELLPFKLTDDQRNVLAEIYKDCTSNKQMNRLVQGDVGSGKTIVAFIAMLMNIDSGFQSAMIAPTEILATQHFLNLQKFADALELPISLLTGSVSKKNKIKIAEDLASGETKIIVGTHALIEEYVKFDKLGLVVIDEQHRFGVEQREKMWKKNAEVPPHVLIMTATPIPRTLSMALYGDLDVSTIKQLPPGRKPIVTKHYIQTQMKEVFDFVRGQLRLERQIYFVYPLIEESEKLDLKALEEGYEEIRLEYKNYRVGMLHGKMKAKEKDQVMQDFKNKKYQILVSTTVIEVGVDVPNATVMVIEEAHRFGLSQLHQLRGRVGRGDAESFCLLTTDHKLTTSGKTRIKAMVDSTDGFYLAEVDMQLRGAGNVEGTAQSGSSAFRISDLTTDLPILQESQRRVEEIVENDPKLEQEAHQVLLTKLRHQLPTAKRWSKIG